MRDGQQVDIYTGVVWTLTGKRGNLVLRERTEWTDLGQDLNRDGVGFRYGSGADGIATGTWKVARHGRVRRGLGRRAEQPPGAGSEVGRPLRGLSHGS